MKDTHYTLPEACYGRRGQTELMWCLQVKSHWNPVSTSVPRLVAKRWKLPKPWWWVLLGNRIWNWACPATCSTQSSFETLFVTFIVSHQACWMTHRVVINIGTHFPPPTPCPTTHTLCCRAWESSAGTSLTQEGARDMDLGVERWDECLKLTEWCHKVSFHDWFSLSYSKWRKKVVCRRPREPAHLGATREGLARRFLPFKGAHFAPKFNIMTMIALAYSVGLLLAICVSDKYFWNTFLKIS